MERKICMNACFTLHWLSAVKLKFNHVKRRKSKKHSLLFLFAPSKGLKRKNVCEGPKSWNWSLYSCSAPIICFHLIMITKIWYSNSIFQIAESHYMPLAHLPKFWITFVFISPGSNSCPKGNWKQSLCKILGGT